MDTHCNNLVPKWIDKVVLLGCLAILLFSVPNAVNPRPMAGTNAPPMPAARGTEGALLRGRNVLNMFLSPSCPDAGDGVGCPSDRVEPGPEEKQSPRCGCERPAKDSPLPPRNDVPFQVLEITSRSVDVLFKGLYIRPNYIYVLKFNWANNTRTSMIPVGGFFHGYRLHPLEKRLEEFHSPPYFHGTTRTRYFLTLTKKGKAPVSLEMGESIAVTLPAATLQARGGRWSVVHEHKTVTKGQTTFEVYATDTIREVGGQYRQYEVLEIEDNKLVLQDWQGERHVLSAPPPQEAP